MSAAPQPDLAELRVTRSLAELVMTLRLADASISMRLCRCPPANADDVRAAQLKLRATIAELRAIAQAEGGTV